MGMDQYLLIPFLRGWTSINPSYFDVNYRGTRFWHTAISTNQVGIHYPNWISTRAKPNWYINQPFNLLLSNTGYRNIFKHIFFCTQFFEQYALCFLWSMRIYWLNQLQQNSPVNKCVRLTNPFRPIPFHPTYIWYVYNRHMHT